MSAIKNKLVYMWKEFKKPSDIFSAQYPLIIVSFLCGISPYKLVGDVGQRRLEHNYFGYVIAGLLLALYFVCYIDTLMDHESIVGYFFHTNITNIGNSLQLFTGLLGLTSTFAFSHLRRKKLVTMLQQLGKIDMIFRELGVETDYKYTVRYIVIVLVVKFIIFLTYLTGCHVLLRDADAHPKYTVWISFFLPQIMISMNVVKFMCYVKQLRHRFLLLNKVCMDTVRNFFLR